MNPIWIILGLSMLPVWRPASGWKGQNFWEYAATTIFREQLEHITIEEAIEEARRAYCEVNGLDYEQSYTEHYQKPQEANIGFWPEAAVEGTAAMSLPFWRSGLHEGITGWSWAFHHMNESISNIPVTHIPREKYIQAFTGRLD